MREEVILPEQSHPSFHSFDETAVRNCWNVLFAIGFRFNDSPDESNCHSMNFPHISI